MAHRSPTSTTTGSSYSHSQWHGDDILFIQAEDEEHLELLDSPVYDHFGLPSPASSSHVDNRPKLRLDTLILELQFEILEHMELADALRFRLVSRHCAEMVLMAPSILRRMLRHIKAPLPYSPKPIQTLAGKEVISLCRRAFALEANWQRKLDRVRAHSFFPLHRPYQVSLAPGGRYLISAYRSTSGEEHFIGLYDLEHPEGMVCLASCPTETALTYLSTSWMTLGGQIGIAITWIRERPFKKTSVTSPDIEVAVLFISLDKIEELANPLNERDNSPFVYLCCKRWKSCIVRVCTANGYLAVARSPNVLSFYDLESDAKSSIILAPLPHSAMNDPVIFAIKLLCDGTALIIRSEDGHSPHVHLHAIEAYAFPEMGHHVSEPLPVQCSYVYSNQTNYDISAMYQRQRSSDDPSEEEILDALAYLPPVTISVESAPPAQGITQYRLFPSLASEPQPKIGYVWPVAVWQGHYAEHDIGRTRTRHLAGADRSLGFPFTAPGGSETADFGEFMVLDSFGDETIPSVGLPSAIERGRVQCVTWDESSGKVCLSTVGDLKVWVLDFAV